MLFCKQQQQKQDIFRLSVVIFVNLLALCTCCQELKPVEPPNPLKNAVLSFMADWKSSLNLVHVVFNFVIQYLALTKFKGLNCRSNVPSNFKWFNTVKTEFVLHSGCTVPSRTALCNKDCQLLYCYCTVLLVQL